MAAPLAVVLISTVILSGWSTIVGRQRQQHDVLFRSNLENVEVTCAQKTAMTPGTIALRQSRNHSCTARKEGYETQIVKVRSGLSWKGFGHSTLTNAAAWGWWTLGNERESVSTGFWSGWRQLYGFCIGEFLGEIIIWRVDISIWSL